MTEWLAFARGPLFRFSFAVMVLGLGRHVAVTIWGLVRAFRLSDDKNVSWRQAMRQTFDWLVPVRHLRQRWFYSLMSVIFHICVIMVPIFLLIHIRLLQKSIGVSWWALPMVAADVLTLTTVATLLVLISGRVGNSAARGISRVQDYLIPALIMVPFLSGFLAAHPTLNPFPYNPTLLVHILGADLCILLVPFTKLAHMVLLPLSQLPSELAWRFPPDYPERVARQIGTEGRAI
jgi:nitrate reductase gamma subunit